MTRALEFHTTTSANAALFLSPFPSIIVFLGAPLALAGEFNAEATSRAVSIFQLEIAMALILFGVIVWLAVRGFRAAPLRSIAAVVLAPLFF